MYESMLTGHKPNTPSDDGYFKFCAPPGTYEVRIDLPSTGLVPTIRNSGSNGSLALTNNNESTVDSDVNFNQRTGSFTVDCNTGDVCNIGAGYYPMAQVGNRVWHDENGDGMQSASEVGVSGVQVLAYDADDNMVSEDVTDADGAYMVDYLGKDDYYLKFIPPSGYGMTQANAGDDAMDSDVDHSNGPGTTTLMSLNPGDDLPTVDAGLVFGVVPVEWMSFTGKNKGSYNQLDWATAKEVNSSHFVIEKRFESEPDFVEIGKVAAAGSSNGVRIYDAKDYDIERSGVYYYRLQQVDLNGNYSYSDIISIVIEGTFKESLEMYPNPAKDEVNISLNVPSKSAVKISIWDATGKLVTGQSYTETMEAGNYVKTLEIAQLSEGMYTVKIEIGNASFKKKLIKIQN